MDLKKLETIEQEMECLKKIIEDIFGLDDMMSNSRERKYIDARMIYSKILKDRGHTLTSIGRSLNKDHATILHHVVRSEYLIKQEEPLHRKYLSARAEFLCDREVFYKNPSQRDMINRINSLTNQLEVYINERERVLIQENNYKRLRGIIKLLSEKLPEGKESLAEKKIKRMLNLEIM
jgi:hypothetical protein